MKVILLSVVVKPVKPSSIAHMVGNRHQRKRSTRLDYFLNSLSKYLIRVCSPEEAWVTQSTSKLCTTNQIATMSHQRTSSRILAIPMTAPRECTEDRWYPVVWVTLRYELLLLLWRCCILDFDFELFAGF